MRNQSSNTAVGKHQTKQVRNRSRTAQKGVKCILRNVPENAFNPSLHLLYHAALFRYIFPRPFRKVQRQPLREFFELNNGKHLRSLGTKRALMLA